MDTTEVIRTYGLTGKQLCESRNTDFCLKLMHAMAYL